MKKAKRFANINDDGLRAALDAFSPNVERGALSAFAVALKVSVAAVSQWKNVPVHMISKVETLTGVSRAILRPDLYPVEKKRA